MKKCFWKDTMYDGYSFMYFGDGNPTYYVFFNPDEILRYRVG